ncbi:hypothetical protein SDJN02_15264, partial [Cucurbita argyrosperma subsp. argyrosperma]
MVKISEISARDVFSKSSIETSLPSQVQADGSPHHMQKNHITPAKYPPSKQQNQSGLDVIGKQCTCCEKTKQKMEGNYRQVTAKTRTEVLKKGATKWKVLLNHSRHLGFEKHHGPMGMIASTISAVRFGEA